MSRRGTKSNICEAASLGLATHRPMIVPHTHEITQPATIPPKGHQNIALLDVRVGT
jgi:hypothetical protein